MTRESLSGIIALVVMFLVLVPVACFWISLAIGDTKQETSPVTATACGPMTQAWSMDGATAYEMTCKNADWTLVRRPYQHGNKE